MKNDYLWDRSGPPDPEVQRLERVLSGLGFRGGAWTPSEEPAPETPAPEAPRGQSRPIRFWLTGLAAAGLLLWSGLWLRGERSGWSVEPLSGTPRVADAELAGPGRLRPTDWLETDAASSARLMVGEIGTVVVAPNSRVQRVAADPHANPKAGAKGTHGLKLDHGKLTAKVTAPPRLFFVDTPTAKAWDLGCAYVLEIDPKGSGTLDVTQGYVELEHKGITAYVPYGARCRISAERGPGTPWFPDSASPELLEVLDKLDLSTPSEDIVDLVCRLSGERDTLSLWNLVPRLPLALRGKVFDRVARILTPMKGVTRVGIEQLDRRMMEDWRDQLSQLWM
jgi:hypothetical protein